MDIKKQREQLERRKEYLNQDLELLTHLCPHKNLEWVVEEHEALVVVSGEEVVFSPVKKCTDCLKVWKIGEGHES